MENWQIAVVQKKLPTLVKDTSCNTLFLSNLVKSGVLSLEEVNDLQCTPTHGDRVYKFYNILLTREHGYIKVMEALKETNQSGALEVLRTELTKYKAGIGNKSLSYDVTDLLGKGSYDTIMCKGKWDNRDVAVKRINSDNSQSSKISMEIKNLIACDNHENVIRYFHTEIENNYVLLVLELCDMNLKHWVRTKDIPISSREVVEQITAGLGWLHHHCRRIVHRDLKPENILLVSHQKRVKLSDFGLSRQIPNDRNSISTYGSGTQGWIAPEILQQKMVDGKCKFTTASDVFSLGCLWYYVLTDGKHPSGDTIRRDGNILDGKVMIEGDAILHICAQNVLFIQQMVSTDPASRPSCAALQASTIFWSPEREEKFISEALTTSVIDSSLDECQLLAEGTCRYFNEHCCSITSLYIKLQNNQALMKYYAENAAFNYHFPMTDGNLIQNEQIPTLIDQQNSDTAIPVEPDTEVFQLFKSAKTGNVNNSVKVVKNLREQNINLTEMRHQVMKTQDFPMSDGNMTQTEETSPLVDPYSSDVTILVEPDTKVFELFETVKMGDAYDSIKLVENLREQNINLTEIRHQEMKTLLHAAVKFQSLSFVSYLIEKQGFDEVLCNPDMRDLIHRCVAETKCKPLHWIKQKKKVMFYLHQRKPELFIFPDTYGRTPIFSQNIHPRLSKFLHMLKLQKSRFSFLMCRGVGNFKVLLLFFAFYVFILWLTKDKRQKEINMQIAGILLLINFITSAATTCELLRILCKRGFGNHRFEITLLLDVLTRLVAICYVAQTGFFIFRVELTFVLFFTFFTIGTLVGVWKYYAVSVYIHMFHWIIAINFLYCCILLVYVIFLESLKTYIGDKREILHSLCFSLCQLFGCLGCCFTTEERKVFIFSYHLGVATIVIVITNCIDLWLRLLSYVEN